MMDPLVKFLYMRALTRRTAYVEGEEQGENVWGHFSRVDVGNLKEALSDDETAMWVTIGGVNISVKETNEFLRKYIC